MWPLRRKKSRWSHGDVRWFVASFAKQFWQHVTCLLTQFRLSSCLGNWFLFVWPCVFDLLFICFFGCCAQPRRPCVLHVVRFISAIFRTNLHWISSYESGRRCMWMILHCFRARFPPGVCNFAWDQYKFCVSFSCVCFDFAFVMFCVGVCICACCSCVLCVPVLRVSLWFLRLCFFFLSFTFVQSRFFVFCVGMCVCAWCSWMLCLSVLRVSMWSLRFFSFCQLCSFHRWRVVKSYSVSSQNHGVWLLHPWVWGHVHNSTSSLWSVGSSGS